MKIKRKRTMLDTLRNILLIMICLLCDFCIVKVTDKPFVIPELKEWTAKKGYFTFDEGSRIVYNQKLPELVRIAQQLSDDYYKMFNRKLQIVSGASRVGDIEIVIHPDKHLGKEGYSIVLSDRVVISAPEAIGIYWEPVHYYKLAE